MTAPEDTASPLTRAQRVQRLALPVLVLVVVLAAVVRSFDFSAAAREVPLAVGVPLLALCVASIALEARNLRRPQALARAVERAERPVAATNGDDAASTEDPAQDPAETGFGELAVFGIFALLAVCWLLFGFPVGAAVFLGVFLKVVAKRGWIISAAVVAGTVVPLQFVFVELSNVPSFPGVLFR